MICLILSHFCLFNDDFSFFSSDQFLFDKADDDDNDNNDDDPRSFVSFIHDCRMIFRFIFYKYTRVRFPFLSN